MDNKINRFIIKVRCSPSDFFIIKKRCDLPMIELINIKKSFKVKNEEVVALSNINLKINNHEIFGIIGLSGAE